MKILSLFLASALSSVAALPEVDLVFYGRVLHLGGGQPHVLTSGELSWLVENEDEDLEPFLGTTQLSPLKGGAMSYQLRVPQNIVVANTSDTVVPGLMFKSVTESEVFRNTVMSLNGTPLRLLDPGAASIELSSQERGTFKRLDLVYEGPLPDADGDGLPDWWEDKYGTNRDVADALEDPDSDEVSNLAEYLAGTTPTGSDQMPSLASEYLLHVPAGGKAVPTWQAIDSDSHPEALVFEVTGLSPSLSIRKVGEEEQVTAFTQQDLNEGRVYFSHVGDDLAENEFSLVLRDETPAHVAATSQVRVLIREGKDLWASWHLSSNDLPEPFPAVQDASRNAGEALLKSPSGAQTWGQEIDPDGGEGMARLFLGGTAADVMLGSNAGDYFVVASGDRVQPGEGPDEVFLEASGGLVTVYGFNIEEGDILNLTGILVPEEGRLLDDYLRFTGNVVEIDANGDGSGYTDASVVLENSALPMSLADFWDAGSLETGVIVPSTTLYLTQEGTLSEENRTTTTLIFRRRGDAAEPLVVPLSYAGTATMGLDFESLPSSVTFPVDEKVVELVVVPLADDELEPTETIQVQMGGGDWNFEGSSMVTLELLDLPSRAWLEVAERIAVKDFGSSAQLLVRRSGPMSAPLTVRLDVAGTATPFLDYVRLSPTVTFAPAQSVLTLNVEPLGFGVLTNGAETVEVSVAADEAYLLGETPSATALIVEAPSFIGQWMDEYGIELSREEFLSSDLDGDGLTGLAEFAFGGNPSISDLAVAYPQVERDGEGKTLVTFRRRPFAPELSYRLESSVNLENWVEVTDTVQTGSRILEDGMEEVFVMLDRSLDSSCFFRVVAE